MKPSLTALMVTLTRLTSEPRGKYEPVEAFNDKLLGLIYRARQMANAVLDEVEAV